MGLDFSALQRAFRDGVRAFIRDGLPEHARQRPSQGHPPRKDDTVTWQRILHERGWAARRDGDHDIVTSWARNTAGGTAPSTCSATSAPASPT